MEFGGRRFWTLLPPGQWIYCPVSLAAVLGRPPNEAGGNCPHLTSLLAYLVLDGSEHFFAYQFIVGLFGNLPGNPALLTEAAILEVKWHPIVTVN